MTEDLFTDERELGRPLPMTSTRCIVRFAEALTLAGAPLVSATIALSLAILVAPASASTLQRPADPVVLKGSDVPTLQGAAPSDVVAFRYDGGWVQIPVQVDERDQVEFARVYGAYDTGVNPTGLAQGATGVFEEQYTDTGTFAGADSDPNVDADDEIVFMARDAGDAAGVVSEPVGVVADSGVEVQIDDPVDGGLGYVYLFRQAGGLDPAAGQQYVTYDFNLLSGDYKTTYLLDGGPGSSHGPQYNAEDSTITTAHYERHWSFRSTNDALRIFAGAATGVDILEKRDYWIAPGSCGRHNGTFNAQEGAFFANRSGPVRAIRSFMGNNSGPLTQSEIVYYEAREDARSFARVHSRPATGIGFADYSTAAFGMTYANSNNPAGVTIDGVADSVTAGPMAWELVTGPQGSVVSGGIIDTDIPNYFAGVTSYYRDELNTAVQICQPCEEAPTAVCPTVGTENDPHLIGSHGAYSTTALPNTDPRNPPFNNLEGTLIVYYDAPGLDAVDAAERRAWIDTPLAATASPWTSTGGVGHLPVRSLKVSRLTKPAGEQRATLKSDPIDATAATFNPIAEGLSIGITPGGLTIPPPWTLTIPPGDPDWKASATRFKWRAKTAPHPQGLSSVTVGTSGSVFKLKAKAKDVDATPITGLGSIDVSLTIGDDVWTGPAPSCVLSGSGSTLKCK